MDNQEIKEELVSIKKELKTLSKILIEYKVMEQKIIQLQQQLISSNAKHDEGRKVLHKRLDAYAKIFLWFGTTVFTGMAGVIWTLVDRILKG